MDRRTRMERFLNLLEALVDTSEAQWEEAFRDPGFQHLCRLRGDLQERIHPLKGEQVLDSVPSWDHSVLHVSPRQPIYLPPFRGGDEDYIVLLSLEWAFSEEDEQWDPPENGRQTIRAHMVREAEEPGPDGRYRSVCFHLDGWNNTGGYCFYHVQIGERPTPGLQGAYQELPGWLPSEEPRIPLPANGPVELLLCVCSSFFGMNRGLTDEIVRTLRYQPGDGELPVLRRVVEEESERAASL